MYVLSIEEGTKSPKEKAKYLAQAIVLSKSLDRRDRLVGSTSSNDL